MQLPKNTHIALLAALQLTSVYVGRAESFSGTGDSEIEHLSNEVQGSDETRVMRQDGLDMAPKKSCRECESGENTRFLGTDCFAKRDSNQSVPRKWLSGDNAPQIRPLTPAQLVVASKQR